MRVPVLIALLLTAGTAQAQIIAGPLPANAIVDPLLVDSRGPHPGSGRDVHDIRHRIDRARSNGTLSRKQTRALRRRAGAIGAVADRYAKDGASEQRILDVQAFALRDLVNRELLRSATSGGKP